MMPELLGQGRRRMLIGVFALICAEGAAAGAAAFATRMLFNALHGQQSLPTQPMALLAISGLLIALCRVAARTRGERMGQHYALDIRHALFNQGTAMSVSDVSARRAGYMSLRFVGDLTAFRNWLGLGLPRLLAAVVLIPTTLLVLGWMHLPFIWVVAPLFLAALMAIGLGGLKLPSMQRRVRSRRAAIAADMAERMPIAPELGQLGRRSLEAKRIDRRSRRLISAALTRVRHAEVLKSVPDMVAGCSAVAVIWIGSRHNLDTGTIAGALSALGIALKPMRDLAGVWNHGAAFSAAHKKCVAALQRPRRREAPGGRQLARNRPLSVSFVDTVLPPISGLNARISAGSRVKLAGANGAGKSRLMNALAGLDTLDGGAVTLNGENLADLSQGSLRRSIVRIGSNPAILKGTLRKALTLGLDRRPDDGRILKAAGKAGLDAMLESADDLEYTVAEGGRNLSAGQRVKISMVRAMLSRPGLILIDSSAAQLDRSGIQALADWVAHQNATVMASEQVNLPSELFDQKITLDQRQKTSVTQTTLPMRMDA
ncbi:ATP-binding cassette domain-containing protein [Marinobacter confluentis]|uniref:ABC transporter ATP-binding protein n=1 Tax=Marinobacter confluentis TaxID=1697557 RepID=A0A4Z1BKY1_9GAMM|nr:ABC transporter ATP-binding protein [Marinobacter confluentis]TGN40407.1 ABC transporter ATP-binding protein [Marinobacter confluentis]